MKIGIIFREMSDYSRFFDNANVKARRIVFYSERDIYYQYFEALIEYLLQHDSIEISYLTSDYTDPLFQNHHPRMKVFYINKLLPSTLKKLSADVLIMTMPDLNRFHIKKSPGTRNHIYLFHAIVSTHLQYRKGAFNDYNTIFCVGPHHVKEIRRAEEIYSLKPKTLIESGYHRLEKIYREHQVYFNKKSHSDKKIILVAPTWGDSSLLEICADELIPILGTMSWDCIIRPHPEFITRHPREVDRLSKLAQRTKNITLETDMISDVSIHSADILITDRSGIAYEYAFGTERPVLFVDTPLKINNPEYEKLGIEPIEVFSRPSLGVSIGVNELKMIPGIIDDFFLHQEEYRAKIAECRNAYIFNWRNSAQIEGEYILNQLKK